MTLVFNVALHVLLVGSMVGFLVFLIMDTIAEPDRGEKFVRVLALVGGALVALGAKASGVDYATFAVQAMAGARPASAIANVGATVIPALLGAGFGFFITRTMSKSEEKGKRWASFIGMLALIAFLQVYAEAADVNGIFLGKASIPNVSFVTGVILTYVATYDKNRKNRAPDPATKKDVAEMIGEAFRRFQNRNQGPKIVSESTETFRDPFAD